MSTIVEVVGREVLDSAGEPDRRGRGRAALRGPVGAPSSRAAPAPAPTRPHELRDGGERYGGKGVRTAVEHVNGEIADAVVGLDGLRPAPPRRRAGHPRRHRRQVAASAPTPSSACRSRRRRRRPTRPSSRSTATSGGANAHVLPVPFMNVLNGGAHADCNVDVQEFMLAPVGAASFAEALRWGVETYHALEDAAAGARASPPRWATKAASRRTSRRTRRRWRCCSPRSSAPGYTPGRRDRARARRRVHRALRRRPLRARGRGRRLLVGGVGRPPGRSCATATRSCRSRTAWPRTTGTAGLALTQRLGARVQLVGDDLFVTNVERLAARASSAASPTRSWSRSTRSARCRRRSTPCSSRAAHGYTAMMSHRSRRDRGRHDRRPRGRHELRPDQDRRARAQRPRRQVQPAAAHRGGARPGGVVPRARRASRRPGRVADHKRVRSGPARPAPPRSAARSTRVSTKPRDDHASHARAPTAVDAPRAVPRRARRPAVRVRVPDQHLPRPARRDQQGPRAARGPAGRERAARTGVEAAQHRLRDRAARAARSTGW